MENGATTDPKTGSAWYEAFYPIKGRRSLRKEPKNELRLQFFDKGPSKPGRRRRDRDSGRFHCRGLGTGVALAAGNDRAGMTHAAAGRRRDARNEPDHRLLAAALGLVFQELGGVFFGRSADFADHDDRGGLGISQKHLQHVNEFGALDRIAADADRGGLAE